MAQLNRLYRSLATAAVAATGSLLASVASAGEASAGIIPQDLDAGADDLASGVLEPTAATATGATGHAVGPALDLRLNPLANTTTDLLSNSASTQIADFRPIGTDVVTGPLSDGASARELPGAVVGRLLGG